jgi:hypothetical protein
MEQILELELQKQELQALLLVTKEHGAKELINDEIAQLEQEIYYLKMDSIDNVDFVENY